MTMLKRFALHALVALNGVLALGLIAVWLQPDGSVRNVRWEAPAPQMTDFSALLPVMPGVVQADTSQFIAMLDRPVFSASRRPPPPAAPVQAAESEPVDSLSTARLSGVFFGDGVGGIIIDIAGKQRRAKLNDAVDGWTLKAIQGRSVTFSKAGQSRVLQLPRAAVTTYTGMAPAATAPAGVPRMAPRAMPLSSGALPSPGAQGAASGGQVQPPMPRATFGGSR